MTRQSSPSSRSSEGATRAVGALFAGDVVNRVTRFASSVVLARTLTLEEFGLVNVGIAISGVLAIVASLGLSDYGARVVAVEPTRIPSLAASVVAVRVGALSALTVAAIGLTWVAAPDRLELVLLSAAMAVGITVSLDWTLRGQGRMTPVAVASAAGGTLLLVLCLTVVTKVPTTSVALLCFTLAELAAAGATWYATRVVPTTSGGTQQVGLMVREAWPMAVSAVIVYASVANLDTVLLSVLRSPEEAGLYSAPYRVFYAGLAVGIFAGYVYLPRLARAVGTREEAEVAASFRNALTALCAYGVVLVGLTEIAGEAALRLIFGSPFGEMQDTFILLTVAIPWYVVGFPAGYTLLARGRERRFLLGAGVAGSLNLAFNLLLIPSLGAEGAAAATTLALIVATVLWIRDHAMLSTLARSLQLLAVTSLGAGLVLAVPAAAPFIGFATALLGVFALGRAHRDSRRHRDRPRETMQ